MVQQENRADAIAYDLVDGLGRWAVNWIMHILPDDKPLRQEEVDSLEVAIVKQFQAHNVGDIPFTIGYSPNGFQVTLEIHPDILKKLFEDRGDPSSKHS